MRRPAGGPGRRAVVAHHLPRPRARGKAPARGPRPDRAAGRPRRAGHAGRAAGVHPASPAPWRRGELLMITGRGQIFVPAAVLGVTLVGFAVAWADHHLGRAAWLRSGAGGGRRRLRPAQRRLRDRPGRPGLARAGSSSTTPCSRSSATGARPRRWAWPASPPAGRPWTAGWSGRPGWSAWPAWPSCSWVCCGRTPRCVDESRHDDRAHHRERLAARDAGWCSCPWSTSRRSR